MAKTIGIKMYKYALAQLKTNKVIKIMTVLVLSILVIVFSLSVYLSDAVFSFFAPRYFNPKAKVDVQVSATSPRLLVETDALDKYKDDYIQKLTPSVNAYALTSKDEKTQFVAIRGVDSKDMFYGEDYQTVEGTLSYNKDECVVPYKYAKNIGVNVGDNIQLECNSRKDDFKVVGIYKGFDMAGFVDTIFVSNSAAAYLALGSWTGGIVYNTLNVQLKSGVNATEFVKIIQKDVEAGSMTVTVVKDLNQFNAVLNIANVPTAVCIIMLLFLVFVVVFALQYLDGIKQHKLVTVFRDLGASTGQIFSVFLGSQFVMSLIGGVIGGILAAIISLAVSSVVGIVVNPFIVALVGFALLLVGNTVLSIASTYLSIRQRKKPRNKTSKTILNYGIKSGIIVACIALFAIISNLTKPLMKYGFLKNFVTVSSFVFLLIAIWAAISIIYDLYKVLHIKFFRHSSKVGLWMASSSSLKSSQTKNFFVMLTVIIVTIVTSSSLLYSLQHVSKSTIGHNNDTVISCENVQDKSVKKFYDIFSSHDVKIYRTASVNLNLAVDDNLTINASVLDLDLIDDLSTYKDKITKEQREYFSKDSKTIGLYYSLSRQDILKEKDGAIKSFVTDAGIKDVPYLGKLTEKGHMLREVFINRATAEFLGINLNKAYVRLLSGDIDVIMADTTQALFQNNIIAISQKEYCLTRENANKPIGDMFSIVNTILTIFLFLTLVFYVVLISNYQVEHFNKLKALGMTRRSILSAQTVLIVPVCALSGLVAAIIAQLIAVCYNIIFSFMAVGVVRNISLFSFIGLPILAAIVGAICYMASHYAVAGNKQSVRNDLER